MNLTLIIGNKNYSSWSLRPWLLMRYYNIPFQEIKLPLDTPEFYQRIETYSPTRRVPALLDGDEKIWDSLAICETINDRYLDGKAWPHDSKLKALARSVAAEMHSGFSSLRSQLPMNCYGVSQGQQWKKDAQRDIQRIQAIWIDLRSRFKAQGNFLCGDFSIADAMYAPVCIRFHTYGVAMDAESRNYVDTIYQIPAMQEWLDEAKRETEQLNNCDV
jgi:glutathione S-transferase